MKRDGKKKISSQDYDNRKNTMPLILLTFAVIAIIACSEILLRRPASTSATLITGITIFAIGFIIRLWSQIELGKNFRYEVKTWKSQTLTTHGIHSKVRHPMFTGLFLIVIGLCISFNVWFGLISSIVLLIPIGLYRINVEESAMVRHFGKTYKRYMKTTKKLVPYIY